MVAQVPIILELKTYFEALNNKDVPHWKNAMETELSSIYKNNTWTIVMLPPGRTPIGCRWVYKIKLNHNGTIQCFKTRLVAKGYHQSYGIDYDETYSPVVKLQSLQVIFVLATQYDLELYQLDVKTAFLNGNLDEELYMQIPQGLTTQRHHVCKLNRSIYGLKQSNCMWYIHIDNYLIKIGFTRSTTGPNIYIYSTNIEFLILAIYVDNTILATNSVQLLHYTKTILNL